MKTKSIKKQIFLSTFLITGGALILVIFAMFYNSYKNSLISAERYIQGENKKVVTFLDGYFRELTHTVEFLSQDPDVVFANKDKESLKKTLSLYKRITEVNKNIRYLYSGYSDKKLVINDYTPPEGFDPTVRPWYQLAIKSGERIAIIMPYEEASTKELNFSTVRIIQNNQNIVGVMAADYSLQDVLDFINAPTVYKSLFHVIVNENNEIFIHPDKEWIGKKVEELINKINSSEKIGNWSKYYYLKYKSQITGWTVFSFAAKQEIINPILTNVLLIAIISFAFSIFSILLLSNVLGGKIVLPVKKIVDILYSLARGDADLRTRINVSLKNEIGELASYFNIFMENQQNIIKQIKIQGLSLSSFSEDIATKTAQSSSSIQEILASSKNVGTNMNRQKEMVEESGKLLDIIIASASQIEKESEKNQKAVENASSAVEEMAASIFNSASMAKECEQASEELLSLSEEANNLINDLSETIKNVASQSSQITEIVELIMGISEQTNLLAMNAAIEAAHAGEYGKGFAVVAEEIRKLADKSLHSSKEIDSVVKKIGEGIALNQKKGENTIQNFQLLNEKINKVSRINHEIASAAEEQKKSNESILKTITSIRELGNLIAEKTAEETHNAEKLKEVFEKLSQISREVSIAMEEEDQALRETAISSEHIREIASEQKTLAKDIQNNFQKFKTE
ncbi:MAG TPA: methyl-accepting chemotaxis protein [Spirochaetota bacterium]|nr:methyl-accepting chemotaxis protein [Spirochaetota bacterium]HPP03599.1 methyl-accepting chemotaxis protein [Spirochaetota bacterium]